MRMIIASVLLLTLLGSSAAFAQAAESENRNLNDQFRELRDKAETYNEYRVIKGSSLNSFWKSVQDSLQSYRTGMESRAATISVLNTQLNDLRQRANQLEEELNLSRSRENALPFLGFHLHKHVYNTVVWSLIFALAAAAIAMSVRSIQHGRNAGRAAEDLQQLETEHEEFRKKAQEKQAKLARELQTERNRVEELNGLLAVKAKKNRSES
jgi:hypothetical protein